MSKYSMVPARAPRKLQELAVGLLAQLDHLESKCLREALVLEYLMAVSKKKGGQAYDVDGCYVAAQNHHKNECASRAACYLKQTAALEAAKERLT